MLILKLVGRKKEKCWNSKAKKLIMNVVTMIIQEEMNSFHLGHT